MVGVCRERVPVMIRRLRERQVEGAGLKCAPMDWGATTGDGDDPPV